MTKKPVICLDADGVLLDMASVWIDFINKRFPSKIEVKVRDIGHWDLEEAFGLSQEYISQLWTYTYQREIPPYDGAREFVSDLKVLGFNVVVVSARSKADEEAKKTLIDVVGVDEVVFSNQKAVIIKELGGILMVDDKIGNAIDVGMHSDADSLLLDRPWNQSLDIVCPYKRVFGYMDIAKWIGGK
jgi:5'(3')-deoxyribonucleotidase